ncbi:MAG: hypothetical protein ACFFGP_13685 [Promethearchaeota archaeon]
MRCGPGGTARGRCPGPGGAGVRPGFDTEGTPQRGKYLQGAGWVSLAHPAGDSVGEGGGVFAGAGGSQGRGSCNAEEADIGAALGPAAGYSEATSFPGWSAPRCPSPGRDA